MEGLTSPFYDKDWPLWHFIASCISGYRIAVWGLRYPFLRHRCAGSLAVFVFAHSCAPCPLVSLVVNSTLQLRLSLLGCVQPLFGAAGWNAGGSLWKIVPTPTIVSVQGAR